LNPPNATLVSQPTSASLNDIPN